MRHPAGNVPATAHEMATDPLGPPGAGKRHAGRASSQAGAVTGLDTAGWSTGDLLRLRSAAGTAVRARSANGGDGFETCVVSDANITCSLSRKRLESAPIAKKGYLYTRAFPRTIRTRRDAHSAALQPI
jgi:adenylate kinase family enzyme